MSALGWCLRRWGRVLPGLALFALIWWLFSRWTSTLRQDGWLLLYMGAGYAASVLVMLAFTEGWTLRDVGLLLTLAADAVTWLSFAAATFGRHRLTEADNDVIRALFVAGTSLLMVGYAVWLGQTRFGTRRDGIERECAALRAEVAMLRRLLGEPAPEGA